MEKIEIIVLIIILLSICLKHVIKKEQEKNYEFITISNITVFVKLLKSICLVFKVSIKKIEDI